MNSDSVKWLIAGLVGALLTLGVLGTGAFFAARFVLSEFNSEYDDEPAFGPDEWAEEKAEAEREEAEAQKRLEESGLSKRYTTVYV